MQWTFDSRAYYYNIMESANQKYLRTKEDVSETLHVAGIKESDLNNITQILYPESEGLKDQNIKLLELDDSLLEALKNGDSLSFRGNRKDSAVLCTNNQTFDLKAAEISNSWVVVSNLKFAKDTHTEGGRSLERHNIKGIFHSYYEVRECKPKLANLINILEPSSFKGLEYESYIDPVTLYNWDRLRNEVQASDDELRQAFADHLIIVIDGYYRLISFEAEARCIALMLGLLDENSWEIDEIDKEATYEALKDLILKPVFECLFDKYTEPSGKSKDDQTPLYRYNEEKVCKVLAKVLLSASAQTDYKGFMESWKIAVPEKMVPKEEYLAGIALIKMNNQTMSKVVVPFLEENLSDNINERFNELFKAKDKWTLQEITPYISKLASSKMDVNALLTRYVRCSRLNGVKYFCSKYGK